MSVFLCIYILTSHYIYIDEKLAVTLVVVVVTAVFVVAFVALAF